MGLRNGLKRIFRSIGAEAKEKLPGTVGQIAQQTLEVMPVWDQGYAWRAQGNRTAQAVKMAVSENTVMDTQLAEVKHLLTEVKQNSAASAKSSAEIVELLKARRQSYRPSEGETEKPLTPKP